MLIFKMSFRNLIRQKRRTIFTALSMIVGFVMASLFIGWADGSYNHIIDSFTRNRLGHIQIHSKGYLEKPILYNNMGNYNKIIDRIKKTKHITNWTPRIYSGGLTSIDKNSSGARIIGVDPERENSMTNLSSKIIKGKYFSKDKEKELLLGKGLARVLNAEIGDSLVLVSQAADGSMANEKYLISGVLDLNNDISNRSSIYMNLNEAQRLFVLNNRVHEIAINVDHLKNVDKVQNLLKNKLNSKRLDIEGWKEFAKSFYRAMKADMKGMWVSLIVVVVVVAIGVLNTVLMNVLERRREYGLLKSLGTKPKDIVKLVVCETTLLAFFSIIIGTILGLIVNFYFSKHGIAFPEAIEWGGMTFKYMKSEISLRSFIIPAVTVVISAVFVSFFPALKAARTKAAEVMRMF